jgi:hypothetical protein
VALCALSGLMCIGVGDAAASVVGSTWGWVRLLRGSGKTLEGTAAGVAYTLLLGAWCLGRRGCWGACLPRSCWRWRAALQLRAWQDGEVGR